MIRGSKYLAEGHRVVSGKARNSSQAIGLRSTLFYTPGFGLALHASKHERTQEPSGLHPPRVGCHWPRDLIQSLDWNKTTLLVSKENNKHLENHNLEMCVFL